MLFDINATQSCNL